MVLPAHAGRIVRPCHGDPGYDRPCWQPDVMQIHALGHPRGNKRGTCGLCGFEGKLSMTHIPPRAAGNVGEARPAVLFFDEDSGESSVGFGRATYDGMAGWWLCATCNNRTARWESEYGRWADQISLAIRSHAEPAWLRMSVHDPSSDPGAFVRVLWAWMYAIDPKLRWGWPELAASVLSGEPTFPPRGLRLLLTATTSPWIAAIQPNRARWTGQEWDADAANMPRVAVSAPPFQVCLAADGTDPAAGSFDTGAWLADRAGLRRALDLELLIVETLTDEDVERMRGGVRLGH